VPPQGDSDELLFDNRNGALGDGASVKLATMPDGSLDHPEDLAFDRDGNLLALDTGRIFRVDIDTGTHELTIDLRFSAPGLSVAPIPEPSTAVLVASRLAGLAAGRRGWHGVPGGGFAWKQEAPGTFRFRGLEAVAGGAAPGSARSPCAFYCRSPDGHGRFELRRRDVR